jgi:hypothetical protein
VLVVAGGRDAGREKLASTEVWVAGSPAWVAAGPLPSARRGLRGASLGGRLYMAGGFTGEIIVFNPRNKTWVAAGPTMNVARAFHGMAAVPYTAVQRFCPGW